MSMIETTRPITLAWALGGVFGEKVNYRRKGFKTWNGAEIPGEGGGSHIFKAIPTEQAKQAKVSGDGKPEGPNKQLAELELHHGPQEEGFDHHKVHQAVIDQLITQESPAWERTGKRESDVEIDF